MAPNKRFASIRDRIRARDPPINPPPWATYVTPSLREYLEAPTANTNEPRQPRARRAQYQIVQTCGYTTVRPVMLELAEKLGIILHHRLRMSGAFNPVEDYDSDGESDDAKDLGEVNDEEDTGENLWWMADEQEMLDQNGNENPQWAAAAEDMMDGEMRKMSRAMRDGGSDTSSEGPDFPHNEPFTHVKPPSDEEHQANCVITGIIAEAKETANQLILIDNRGCYVSICDGYKMKTSQAWTHTVRVFRKWLTKLHRGCGDLLDYNPIRTALYELVLGWNMNNITPFQPNRGGDFANAARIMMRLQERAWEEERAQAVGVEGFIGDAALEDSEEDEEEGGVLIVTEQERDAIS